MTEPTRDDLTPPSKDSDESGGGSPDPPQVTPDPGYRPVRQPGGDPIVPREDVPAPAPRPAGITLQPPRRGLPLDDGPSDSTDQSQDPDSPEPDSKPQPASSDQPEKPESTPPTSGSAITSPSSPERPTEPADAGTAAGPAEPTPPVEKVEKKENPYARPADGDEPAPRPRSDDDGQRLPAGDLVDKLNVQQAPKAKQGWRAVFGMQPSAREVAERSDEEAARRKFSRPVTIMVANPKGGVGKTPTALLLAATFGSARGGGVVAWDNNELRGTMPDRSVSAHRRNVRDLLDESTRLREQSAGFTDVAHFLNHQTSGTFHTLGSAQESGQAISRENFEVVHEILARFFEIIIVDTGNNEAASNWLAAAATADCLVVPTKWRKDSLIPAARMLESLADVNPDLLNRTLIVATNGPADAQRESQRTAAKWFGSRHSVLEIPTDPHIAEGDVLAHDKLQAATRRAGLAIAAAITNKIGTAVD